MSAALRVLQSFPAPRATTNPYVVQLRRHLDRLPDVEVAPFTWSRALRGRYNVFHVHWPETLLAGRTRPREFARLALFCLLLLRLRVRGTAVVATVHNPAPHESLPRRRRALLRLLARRVTAQILLNDRTPPRAGIPATTVPHGHYRDWFAGHPGAGREPGRMVFAGILRDYKGVPALVRTFRATAPLGRELRLEVAGTPQDATLAEEVRRAATGDDRVTLSLGFLDDAALVTTVTRATLVVLPYREMHNSGAALMALSLDRPVLVPDNDVTRDLAAEVGEQWVLRYRGPLTPERLLEAVTEAAAIPAGAHPDLGLRDWDGAAAAHALVYRRAVAAASVRPYSR